MDNENVFRILTKKQLIIDGSPTFKKFEKEHENYLILVRIFKNIHDASKTLDRLPLNKVSLTFCYRSQAIPRKVFDVSRLAPQQRSVSGL